MSNATPLGCVTDEFRHEFTHVYDVGVLILFTKKGEKKKKQKFGNVDMARPYCLKAA